MSFSRRIIIPLGFVLLIGYYGQAQSSYQTGLLPALNVNTKLNRGWSINFKFESRQQLQRGIFGEEHDQDYEYVLSDLALVAGKKIGFDQSLAGGYLMRFRGQDMIHRLIQQFTIVRRYSSFRLAHRIAADQTMSAGASMTLRLRYRLSTEWPLKGQSVDPREFYIKANHEYLNVLQGEDYDLEIRFVPLLGYKFTDSNKTELGVDYRLDSFLQDHPRQRFWLRLIWYRVF